MNPLAQSAMFLIDTVAMVFTSIVLLRFWLQMVRADFYNPISQATVKLTNPLLIPLRKLIPGFGGIDWAALVLAYLVVLFETAALVWLSTNVVPSGVSLIIMAGVGLLNQFISLLTFLIFGRIVISFINTHHPIGHLIWQLTQPFLGPIQRMMPAVAGIDFSPMVLFVLIGLFKILAVQPLIGLGLALGR